MASPSEVPQDKRILLVESSSRGQKNLAMSLQREGFKLLLPETHAEACMMIEEEPFQLAILSADLPDQGVMAVAKALRMQAKTLSTGAIVTFEKESHGLEEQLASLEIHHYLFKPIEIQQLLGAIHDLIKPMPQKGQLVFLRDPVSGATFKTIAKGIQRASVRLAPEDESDAPELAHFVNRALEAEFMANDKSQVAYQAAIAEVASPFLVEFGELLRRIQRRKSFRRELAIRVRYRIKGDFARLGLSRDLSLGGVLLTGVKGTVAVGDPVELTLVLNAKRQFGPLWGIVRRVAEHEGQSDWGIAFEDLPESQMNELLGIIFGDAREWELVEV